jgi:peptide/nickel transport system permease protein
MARRADPELCPAPLAPGDPIDALLGGQPSSPQTVAAFHTRFGLDRPLHIQYLTYLGVVRGDLGTSFATQRPVGEEIGDRFWNTRLLAGASVSLGLLVGVARAWPARSDEGRARRSAGAAEQRRPGVARILAGRAVGRCSDGAL